MLDNFGDSAGFPDAEAGASSVDRGRLAGLLLRLHARRFTGRAYVSSQGRTMTFAFRDGVPVMIDSSDPQSSLADDLVERGILTRDEYAELIGRVTEDLVENEDVAVCEHAVSLGYLSEEQIHRELSERVRSKLIQSLSLVDCEVELDSAPDALSGVAEYPQNVGGAVYMGVRTFYDEDTLRSYVPDLKRNYMRLSKAPAEIARYFELDDEEVALLGTIDPQKRAIEWFQRSDLETSHAMQLIALMHIANMGEFSSTTFAPLEAERSGVRASARQDSARLRMGTPVGMQRPGSRAAIPAVREEVYEPRTGSRTGIPAVQPRPDSDPRVEPNTTPSSTRTEGSGAFNPPRRTEGSGAHNAPRNEGSGAWNQPRRPIVESNERSEGSGAFNQPRRTEGSGAFNPPRRNEGSGAHNQPRRPESSGSHPQVSPAADGGDAAAEALAEARARARERRGAPHLGGEPKLPEKQPPLATMEYDTSAMSGKAAPQRPQQGSTPRMPVSPGTNQALRNLSGAQPTAAAAAALRNLTAPHATGGGPREVSPEYQKAHLKELMQRKQQVAPAEAAAPAPQKRDPVRELRSAQEALRDSQYARAVEILQALAFDSPDDEIVRTYLIWAQLRASQHLEPAHLTQLKDLAKRLIADAAHASFACYVLAHLYLADKKDEQAEKYFRKAHALDKTNKDAERHIVILERRKQNESEAEKTGERKFLGITFGKKPE